MDEQQKLQLARNQHLHTYNESLEEWFTGVNRHRMGFKIQQRTIRPSLESIESRSQHATSSRADQLLTADSVHLLDSGRFPIADQRASAADTEQTLKAKPIASATDYDWFMLETLHQVRTRRWEFLIPIMKDDRLLNYLEHVWFYYDYYRHIKEFHVRNFSGLLGTWGGVRHSIALIVSPT